MVDTGNILPDTGVSGVRGPARASPGTNGLAAILFFGEDSAQTLLKVLAKLLEFQLLCAGEAPHNSQSLRQACLPGNGPQLPF